MSQLPHPPRACLSFYNITSSHEGKLGASHRPEEDEATN